MMVAPLCSLLHTKVMRKCCWRFWRQGRR
jgi:hypothetical protein